MNFRLGRKVFYLMQKISGRDSKEALRELQLSQYFKPEKLCELQWQRLKKLISFVYQEVPYYHNLFKKSGIRPEDINTYKDFSKIPILTKQMVRDNFKDLHSSALAKKKYFRSITSGSTGMPLTMDIEGDALNFHYASQYRGFSWHGICPGDSGIKLWGVPINPFERAIERLKDLAINRIRFSAFKLSEKQVDDYYLKFKKFKPKYVYGYTSALFHFASSLKKKGLSLSRYKPKVVFSTSEILYPHQRELIELVFDCPVINEYGCAEFGIIAFECAKNNLHITSENVYPEIINPDSQGVGQVIVTGLNNFAMPLIRYELGDLAKMGNGVCDCGISLPVMEKITGRIHDIIKTPDGKIVHSEVLDYINRNLCEKGHGLKEFKMIQKTINNLLVMVVKKGGEEKEVVKFFTEQIRKNISDKMVVSFEFVDKIPLEKSGKVRYFVSEI